MKGKMMSIKNVGELKTGMVSEVEEGVVRIYTLDQFPILELHGNRNEHGVLLDNDADIQATADELAELWNQRARE